MKTSDKILLYSASFALTAFIGTDLLHYAKYRAGEITDAKTINAQEYAAHPLAGIRTVLLDGPIRTMFYPSDHFEFDLQRGSEASLNFERQGDSLRLYSRDLKTRSSHDNWVSYQDYPS